MKVIILGGCGGMGRYASKAISSFDQIQSLTIADLNKEDAEEFAKQLGSQVEGIGLNINDKELLYGTLKSFDIVVNTVGPFFKYGYGVLKTSLDANCHYMDICDDWEPTEKMLELDHLAKERGLLAILGMGASPGITNLLGAIAINELDEAETIYTGWSMNEAKPEDISSQKDTNAAMIHGIEQISGKVKIFKDKKFQMTRPLKEIEIDYPRIGKFKPSIFGHPEAITFPHHFNTIINSINLAHGSGFVFLRWIMKFVDWKIISVEKAANIVQNLSTAIRKELEVEETQNGDNLNITHSEDPPPLYAVASGIREGQQASCTATFNASGLISMGEATGIPLACGLKLLLDGRILKKGVFAPEGAIDPNDFFSELGSISDLANADDGEIISIFRSW